MCFLSWGGRVLVLENGASISCSSERTFDITHIAKSLDCLLNGIIFVFLKVNLIKFPQEEKQTHRLSFCLFFFFNK